MKKVEIQRIVDYLDYFVTNHLESHFQIEEELLFSFLAKNDLMRKEAEEQHRSIRENYKKIIQLGVDVDQLSRFADELEAHIRFEERKLFQYMQVELLDEDFRKMSEKVYEVHRKVEEEWLDEFWGKSKV
ncbi:hypothetical protein GCM10011339_43990 [Echinicola rosea]|uniref:Hemerythrin-like domain-containing protein n=2 Tax=Cyclobacteriaceae TaxID=563798 RepID=A0ABQ1VD99_9BACT|nr:hypothetical protein GCM10011339_43990 [Echinicola rosea]